jgi:mono/diheme cytochrome c family protein
VTRSIATAILLLIAVFSLAQNTGYQPDPTWVAPPKAAAKKNPLAQSPAAVAGGKKIFHRDCAVCHGENGTGTDASTADLQLPVVQQQNDGTLFWKITNGNSHRGMPSFSSLPEMQRWQVVLYIRELGKQVK